MADDYDFQINGLKFRAAVNDQMPYQRATAPFRKDQFDSAPTVGDQSLTGWWTRGQLSFHKGAGLKYYEVLDGETILNRFQDSGGVDVWTAGQASLIPNLADLAVAATSATPGTLSGVSGLFYTTATGMTFYDGSGNTAITTSDSGVPTDVTSDGRYYLAVNGDRIERQSYSGAQRTNYVTNPSFETNTTGWSGSFGATIAASTEQAKYGSQSLKVTPTDATSLAGYTVSGLTSGAVYVLSAWVYLSAGSGVAVTPNATWANASPSARVTTLGSWARAYCTFTASGTTQQITAVKEAASTDPFYLDGVMVTEFPFEGDYFDGSTTGASWTGTAHASTSTYASNSPAASYTLWTQADAGYSFQRAWWAKGRIWAVDNTGRWYTLSPTGGTAHATDAIWTSGKTTGEWSLADSPGSVFIADSGTIYSLSVDVDGSAINLQAPVVAALLPAGEAISDMFYYLGHLIIATSKGVRVAQVQDSQLIYGPLVIEGDFSAARGIGAAGSLVYLVGQPTGHDASTLCVLDLTQEVDTLRPPWAPWVQLNNVAASTAGALVDPSGRLFAWAGNLYGSGTTKVASGSIATGYHRFGTLDPKSFQTVSVRCGGTGGSITVYRVDANGTETSLGTITPAEASKDFALGLTAPTERIALKFTLTRDGADSTKGPELLGYQLKAMPVPKRQRLMKWPLTIMDTFRLHTGREVGKKGRAYTDLTALEALESSSAVVTFTDHRTGETGSAYVDSVEFQSDTPSSATSKGFGGVAYVTLRVLS